jgi:Arm DNA-binding domain
VAPKRINLSERLIAAASCPPGKTEILLWDAVAPGLVVRLRSSGAKTFALRYRAAGGGRAAPVRKLPLGDVGAVSLAEARRLARVRLGEMAGGRDPHAAKAELRAQHRGAERSRLSAALERYDQDLARRRIVKRKEVVSILTRELLAPLGDVDLRRLDRATLVERIGEVEQSGRPGAAGYLRGKVTPFLNWCVGAGLLAASRWPGGGDPAAAGRRG